MTTTSEPNRYFVCLRRSEPPIPWAPSSSAQINKHTAYFGSVLCAMERGLRHGGLTFYLTWDVAHLPTYGDGVVAIVLGDEWARVPTYARRVRAVFKCYGTRPSLGVPPLSPPTYLSILTTLHFLQTQAARLPTTLRYVAERLRRPRRTPNVYPIPLGYANQVALPVKKATDRPYDVSFAGSVVHRQRPAWSPKRWLQTPKSLSRQAMVTALKKIERGHPEWNVGLTLTPGYSAIRTASAERYSRLLMDTKVALAPRGTSFETFRYFEAMRAGCVVITEALPSRWFYDGSPAIQVGDWSELAGILTDLLQDPGELERLHQASLLWWQTVCSEEAVGAFIRGRLNVLADTLPETPTRTI